MAPDAVTGEVSGSGSGNGNGNGVAVVVSDALSELKSSELHEAWISLTD